MNDLLARIEKLSPKRLALLAYELQARLDKAEADRDDPVAIIGMGCRFPCAPDPEAFWRLLSEGRDAISEVPPDRWDIDTMYDPDPDSPGRMATRWGGFLNRVDEFDASFFGISRREAVSMDPQQRLLLEVAWEALEHAGQSPRALAGTATGVFAGMSTGDYYTLLRSRGLESVDAYMATGTAHSVAAGRIAYVLGLHGPNIAIDTACSSSLVAIHLACQSLRSRECRMALAGGVNLILSPDITVALSKSHMMAPDGRCKAFDARADGFVRGEGCGMIVLKRLADARADGDRILAVIRGSALNQDGRSSGITAPNGASQRQVIRAALAAARVQPRDVDYVEAHGTGTALGDPIEAHALAAEFADRGAEAPLIVGSVKANVGHLEACAGVAGLMKVVLSLQHGRIPSQLHFNAMNPHIDWGSVRADIPVGGRDWTARADRRRIAGVSSFGFSGTNAHIIVEEPPSAGPALNTTYDAALDVLTLSARSDAALRDLVARYAEAVGDPAVAFSDVCSTANIGRSHLEERVAVVARSREELEAALRAGPAIRGTVGGRPKIAFLFTGQGSQWVGMGRELYEREPVFRAALDECAALLGAHLERPLLEVIFGTAANAALLDETRYTQPALVALEYALAQLWQSWGITPAAVLGHSVGEYAALIVAGVWSLADGLRVIAERGRLMQELGPGWGMTAVQGACSVAEDVVRGAAAGSHVSIAAVNAPESVVVSGPTVELEALEERLRAAGLQATRLRVSQGFHSAQMDGVAHAFAQFVLSMPMQSPRVTVISSVTGEAVGGDQLHDPSYWRNQVRNAVQFQRAMETLATEHRLFLEVGPSATLLGLGRQCVASDDTVWLASLRRDTGNAQQILESLAQLYVRGADVDWSAYHAHRPRRKVALPTYPFQRQRYWLDTTRSVAATEVRPIRGHAMLQGQVPAAVPIFQAQLGTDAFPFLAEHRVGGMTVLPGSVFLELAFAAAARAVGRRPDESRIVLHDVQLREPLRLGAGEDVVQVVVTRDGADPTSFQILGRPSSRGAEPWTLHATGGIRTAKTPGRAESLAELRGRIATPVGTDAFYVALRSLGVDLGELCRGMRALWSAEREVLGEIVLDPSLVDEMSAYVFHPALLDACLQTFGAALWLRDGASDMRFLTRIGELRLHRAPSARVWCHVSIDEASGSADLCVLDESGALILEASGLETTSASGEIAEGEAAAQPFEDWFYDIAWSRDPAANGPGVGQVLAGGTLATQLRRRATTLFAEQGLDRYQTMQPEMDALASAYIGRALLRMGCDVTPGNVVTTSEWMVSAGVVNAHRSLFGRLLEIMAEDGFLRRRSDGPDTQWEVLARSGAEPDGLGSSLLARFPEFAGEVSLTIRCASKLAEVLQGTTDPLQLLFPGGSMDELEALYTKSPSAHVFNPLITRAVDAALATVPADRPVRILEIGAGTGGTTAFVAPMLPPNRVEYTFTDVSPLFLARAEERFGQFPFMRYAILDIENEAPAAERYDIVIAANVLHATRNLRETLRRVRECVAPDGLLVLLEGTRPERWVDLTFGMTDGWWRFADRELRPRYPLVDSRTWLSLLGEQGFREVDAVAPEQGAQQVVLLAQAPTELSPGRWLIVGDLGGVGAELRGRVIAHGGTVDLRDGRVGSSRGSLDGFDHVVYLHGLEIAPASNARSFAACEKAAEGMLDLMRAVAGSGGNPRLWIVTRGAQPAPEGRGVTSAMQATLWGIGRTFSLEHPDAWGGLCDLDPDSTCADDVEALMSVVLNPCGEDQCALRARVKYVPRLVRRDAPPPVSPKFRATGKYLITGGFGRLGLRTACWLVEHGAREIVLNGRTGIPDRSQWNALDIGSDTHRRVRAVRELEARGATVTVLSADLSASDAAASLRGAFAPGELRGVLHAAAAFDVHSVESLGAADLERVLRTKMLGAVAVADLARAVGIDFLIMFSSTSALFGSGRMAAYSGANAFLDGLAHELRAEGIAALSVDWGIWDELDDLREEERTLYRRSGLCPMPSRDALEALGRVMASGEPQAVVAQVDWTVLTTVYQARRRRPMFSLVANRRATPRVEKTASRLTVSAELDVLTGAERSQRLVQIVKNEAATVLALGAEEIDPRRGLFEMGMDSLMSVELRARLERTFERKLPSTLTFNYPNVLSLAGYLEGLVTPRHQAAASLATASSAPVQQAQTVLRVDADGLSEDEIAAMLSDALQSLD